MKPSGHGNKSESNQEQVNAGQQASSIFPNKERPGDRLPSFKQDKKSRQQAGKKDLIQAIPPD